MRRVVYEAWRTKHETCLYPAQPPCTSQAIAAHSIQNSGTLGGLSEGGHVGMLETRPMFGDSPDLPDFEDRGRNQATTFKGLCGDHDADLFRPIDTNPLDLADPEHVFLLTYRSALKEAYAIVRNGKVLEAAYDGAVADGLLPAGDPLDVAAKSKLSNDAVPLLAEKRRFDGLYLAGHYGEVSHEVVRLPQRPPALAVSGFFSAGAIAGKDRWCALNVFPDGNGHAMVFSYWRRNERIVAERFLGPLRGAQGSAVEQLASRIILENSGNFAVRPSLYASYPGGQRRAIRNHFWGSSTLEQAAHLDSIQRGWGQALGEQVVEITGGLNPRDPRLNLFEAVS